jgi:hypothetical protein
MCIQPTHITFHPLPYILCHSSTSQAQKLAEARERLAREGAARKAQTAAECRSLVLNLRAARAADRRLAMLNQFKQSMVGPEWELDDLDWRPTFLPAMKLRRTDVAAVARDPRKRLLLSFLHSLADLAHPKQALPILTDSPRLEAYERALYAVLGAQGPHTSEGLGEQTSAVATTGTGAQAGGRAGRETQVLVLGAGTGLLGLLAARALEQGGAGGGGVTCIERSRMLYRMAKQVRGTPACSIQ